MLWYSLEVGVTDKIKNMTFLLMIVNISAGYIRNICFICKPCLSYILADACKWYVIHYTLWCFLKYFWNIVGLSFFYHCFLHQFTCTYSYSIHCDSSENEPKKFRPESHKKKRLHKILPGTENASNLLKSALLHVTCIMCILNLPLQQ